MLNLSVPTGKRLSLCLRASLLVFALAPLAAFPAAGQSAAARRVTEKIDESQLTTLAGHVHLSANAANDRGAVDDHAQVGHIMLLFKRSESQQKDLDALVDQMHNVHAQNYHKWLTPAEFGQRFEPADEDVAAVQSWLKSKGLTVEEIPPSKTHITFTGTVGQLRDAFHIEIHHLSVNGEAHISTMNEPQIPTALAPVIAGLHKLNDFEPRPMYKKAGVFERDAKTGRMRPVKGTVTAPSVKDFTDTNGDFQVGPWDFYTIYNENPLLTAGITGAGVTIAVIEETEVDPNDVTSFRAQFSLPPYPATPTATQGGVNYIFGASGGVGGDAACTAPLSVSEGAGSGDEGEADIDLQWAGTVAPYAIVDFVACGPELTIGPANFGSSGVDHAAQHIVNYLASTVTAASLSYGWCESALGSSTVGYYTNQWEQFAAEGITAIVSSGDSGTSACDNGDPYITVNPSVNGMGSSAYNISAGGTDLADTYISNNYSTLPASTWWGPNTSTYGSALSYIPESTWGGLCSNALFSSYLDAIGDGALFGTTPEALCNNATLQNEGFLAAEGGSGGISTVNAAPTWQNVYGVGLYSGSTTQRTLPDLSLFAASGFWGHFMPFCESDVAACTSDPNSDSGAGGTSFVAPQLAGLMALVNQQTHARQGQANYTLYNLAALEYGTPGSPNTANLSSCSGSAQGASVGSTCIFRDIAADTPSLQGGTIASDIVEPCVYASLADCYRSNSGDTYGLSAVTTSSHSSTLSYFTGAGYDMATGLGSVNIANLVNGWTTASPTFASATALGLSSGSILSTQSVTMTATVTATGRGGAVAPAGVVQFYIGSTSGTLLGAGSIAPTCTGTGATTSCDGVASLMVAGTSLNIGSNSIVAFFEGDGANDAASTSTAQIVTVTGGAGGATMTSPTPSTVLAGPSVTFTWSTGSGATGYQLWLGSTGVGSFNLYYSGTIAGTSAVAAHLPTNGETVYARLITVVGGVQSHIDYTYTAATQSALTTPAPSGTLAGPNLTFGWTAAAGATNYQLWLGTTGVGSYNVFYSGPVTATSAAVAHLPTNGATVYARLITNYSGAQVSADYTYTATRTALTTPAPSGTLAGPNVTFSWLTAPGATGYQLWLGTTGAGSYNLYYQSTQAGTSASVAHIPTNGATIYAQLITHFGSVEVYNNYTYTAATQAALTTPAPAGTLLGPSVTFGWSAGTGATNYQLWLGSTGVGSYNIDYSGPLAGTSVAVTHLPTNGEKIYARLVTNYGGVQINADYTYTAATQSALTTPTPGSTFTGASETFDWTTAAGATNYQLWLGSTGAGSYNLYYSGPLTGTSTTVNRLPVNGETVYARLITNYSGVQVSTDYTYIAQ